MADLLAELERALAAAAPLDERDAAAVELARRYATAIDAGDEALDQVGPKLLAALTALGLTPAGRSRSAKGGEPDAGSPANPLDELRARRNQRSA